MTAKTKPATFEEAIANQVVLIKNMEKAIKDSRSMGSDLMVLQYQHLKKTFVQQLNEMLRQYEMEIKVVEE